MSTTARKTSPKKATKSSTTKPGTPKVSSAKKTVATAKKTAPTKPSTAKAPAAQAAKPTVVNAPEPVMVGPALRKKELIDQVVQRTGLKKRDVKPVVESMLGVVGEALAEGRELVAPPFGKLRVHKKKSTATKRILFAKLHQNLPAAPVKEIGSIGADEGSSEG